MSCAWFFLSLKFSSISNKLASRKPSAFPVRTCSSWCSVWFSSTRTGSPYWIRRERVAILLKMPFTVSWISRHSTGGGSFCSSALRRFKRSIGWPITHGRRCSSWMIRHSTGTAVKRWSYLPTVLITHHRKRNSTKGSGCWRWAGRTVRRSCRSIFRCLAPRKCNSMWFRRRSINARPFIDAGWKHCRQPPNRFQIWFVVR